MLIGRYGNRASPPVRRGHTLRTPLPLLTSSSFQEPIEPDTLTVKSARSVTNAGRLSSSALIPETRMSGRVFYSWASATRSACHCREFAEDGMQAANQPEAQPVAPRVLPPATPGPSGLGTTAILVLVVAVLHFGREIFIPIALAVLLGFLLA